MFYFLLKNFFGLLVKLLWIKEIIGMENIPSKGPVILASNHSSYLDFICLISVIKRPIKFLVAEKFFKHPLWLPLMVLTNQIKVDRYAKDKNDSIAKALEVLARGGIIGIFPEGTRSRTGSIQKAYGGVIKLAIEARCMIIPIGINGAFTIWSPDQLAPSIKKKKVIIKIGHPLYVQDYINCVDKQIVDQKLANNLVMQKILELIG